MAQKICCGGFNLGEGLELDGRTLKATGGSSSPIFVDFAGTDREEDADFYVDYVITDLTSDEFIALGERWLDPNNVHEALDSIIFRIYNYEEETPSRVEKPLVATIYGTPSEVCIAAKTYLIAPGYCDDLFSFTMTYTTENGWVVKGSGNP